MSEECLKTFCFLKSHVCDMPEGGSVCLYFHNLHSGQPSKHSVGLNVGLYFHWWDNIVYYPSRTFRELFKFFPMCWFVISCISLQCFINVDIALVFIIEIMQVDDVFVLF